MREGGRVLQICPSDHPPFADICRVYVQALHAIGCQPTTVFLAPPHGKPLAGAIYLNLDDLARTRPISRHLERRLADQPEWELAICHRYRAWQAVSHSRLRPARSLVIAHEYGFFARWSRRWAARLARHTTFAGVSDDVTRSMAPHVRDVMTLPNAIDVDALQAMMVSRDEARAVLGIVGDGLTIGVVGRLHHKKQPSAALAAFRQAGLPGARLVFVGDGPLRGALDRGDPNVVFCGFVADARRYLRAFDALFLPSGGVEAFGMVALEALVAGVPVVCQRAAGPREVLGDLGVYYEADTTSSMSTALGQLALIRDRVLVRDSVSENGVVDPARQYAHAADARARQLFSVEALASRLRSCLDRSVH